MFISTSFVSQLLRKWEGDTFLIFVSASCHWRHQGKREKISPKFQRAAEIVIRFVLSFESMGRRLLLTLFHVGRRMLLTLFHLIILLGNQYIPPWFTFYCSFYLAFIQKHKWSPIAHLIQLCLLCLLTTQRTIRRWIQVSLTHHWA